MRGNVPDVAERITHGRCLTTVRLVSRCAHRFRAAIERPFVPGIYIVHIQHEHCRHRLPFTVSLTHFDDRVTDSYFGMIDDALRRLMTENLFSTESRLQEIHLLGRAPRM